MSAINVNSITGRTGSHGPVLTGVTTISGNFHTTGNAGIGTDNPSNYGGAVKLALHNTGNSGLSIAAGTSSDSNIFFADGTSGDATYRGNIKYAHNGDSMRFHTAAAERVRVTSDGEVGIGITNPSAKLEVATSVDGEATLATFKNTSGGGTNETVDIKLGLENTVASNVILRAGKEGNHGSGAAADNFFAVYTTENSTSSEKLRITSSGNVGIGTDSVGNISNRAQLVLGGDVGGLLDFNVGGDTEGRIFATDATGLTIRATQSDGNIIFQTGGSNERARITSDGLKLPNGGGIDFSATADTSATGASTSNELLDDYEEGTWTPTIRENGTGTEWDTISNRVGTYTKVGQLVTVTFSFTYSARATNVNGGFYGFIAQLPFSNTSTTTNGGASNMMLAYSGGTSTPYHIYLNTSIGNVLGVYSNQDSASPGPMTTNEWPNVAATIRGQFFYYVP